MLLTLAIRDYQYAKHIKCNQTRTLSLVCAQHYSLTYHNKSIHIKCCKYNALRWRRYDWQHRYPYHVTYQNVDHFDVSLHTDVDVCHCLQETGMIYIEKYFSVISKIKLVSLPNSLPMCKNLIKLLLYLSENKFLKNKVRRWHTFCAIEYVAHKIQKYICNNEKNEYIFIL